MIDADMAAWLQFPDVFCAAKLPADPSFDQG